jgi:hypothetical protein
MSNLNSRRKGRIELLGWANPQRVWSPLTTPVDVISAQNLAFKDIYFKKIWHFYKLWDGSNIEMMALEREEGRREGAAIISQSLLFIILGRMLFFDVIQLGGQIELFGKIVTSNTKFVGTIALYGEYIV